MVDDRYKFCKIYIQNLSPSEVMEILAFLLGGRFERRSMYLDGVVVDVLKNPDSGLVDDFVGWPTIVDIDATADGENSVMVAVASSIVTGIWERGNYAVAACDYEDELPWRGGIGRLE